MPQVANTWAKSLSASGVATRSIPPLYLAANSSGYEEIARDLLKGSFLHEGHEHTSANLRIKYADFAPGGIKTFVYPRAGNDLDLGHDLLNDPETRGISVRANPFSTSSSLDFFTFFFELNLS